MFLKTFKYDVMNLWSRIQLWYIMLLGIALVCGIIDKYLYDVSILIILSSPLKLAFILLIISTIFYSLFIGVARVYSTVIKREGYLIQTLPVTKNVYLFSKYLSSLLFLFITFFVMFLAISLISLNFIWIFDAFEFFGLAVTSEYSLIFVLIILMLLLSVWYYYLLFITAIILGQKKGYSKKLQIFISGILVNILNQFIGIVIAFVFMIIDRNLLNSINAEVYTNDEIIKILIMGILSYIVTFVVYHILMKRALENQLNIE